MCVIRCNYICNYLYEKIFNKYKNATRTLGRFKFYLFKYFKKCELDFDIGGPVLLLVIKLLFRFGNINRLL